MSLHSSLDWDVYSKEIDEEIDSNKKELVDNIFEAVKDYIGLQSYSFLEKLIPIIDLSKDEFTLRLSYDCAFNKDDERNILFNLEEELSDYDGRNFDRLDRLKEIFQNGIKLIEKRIIELEEEWARD